MAMKSPTGPEARHRVQEACANAGTVLRECKGDQHVLAVAFQGAVIAFALRGHAETANDWKKDGRTLIRGLNVIERHRQRILDKLALQSFPARRNACRTDVTSQGGGELVISPDDVLGAVLHAIEQAAADLAKPNPSSATLLRERKDAQFLRLLGIEFRKRSLPRPAVRRLRALHEVATGEPFTGDDAAALHAFGG